MDKQKVMLYGGGAILAAAVVLWYMHRRDSRAIAPTEQAAVQNPDAGSGGFNSNVNVNVNANAFNKLSQNFMPLFGMTAVGVVNTGPSKINVEYNITQLQASPMPQYMIPGYNPPPARSNMGVATRLV